MKSKVVIPVSQLQRGMLIFRDRCCLEVTHVYARSLRAPHGGVEARDVKSGAVYVLIFEAGESVLVERTEPARESGA